MELLRPGRRYFSRWAVSIAVTVFFASVSRAQAPSESQTRQPEWVQELNAKYPGLLAEFGQLLGKMKENVQFPPARGESRILPLLPESTMSYAAFPNYGVTAQQALQIFRQELQGSAVLRDWWQHGYMATSGPKVEDALDKFYQVSQYLGDEFVVSGAMEGKDSKMLIVAEVRKPGLKKVLQQMVVEFGNKSKSGVRVLDPQELAMVPAMRPVDELLILVRPDFVVGATDLTTLRNFNVRLEQGRRGFASTSFGQRVANAYQGGVTLLAAADIQKLLSQVPLGTKQDQLSFQRSGFADMKYLVWEHTSVAGQDVSQAELSFAGPRQGAAAWLAKPEPLGSLDFVSPKAVAAGTVVLTSPAQIFEDVNEFQSASNPNAFGALTQAEQSLKLSVKEDLLSCLGGEITLELDSLSAPKPEYRAILQVIDPKRLQQTFSTLLAATHMGSEPFDEDGVTYFTVKVPSGQATTEIGYAFVDGYLIIGSSHETVAEAVRLHKSGESLGKSKKFLASLPPNRSVNASALFYQDPIAMTALRLRQSSPEMAGYLSQLTGESSPGVILVDGEKTAIRETSRGGAMDVAATLVVAAIAIPNLLKSRIAANEASAVGMTRTVNTAEVTYQVTYPKRGFAPDLATLGPDPRGPEAYSADHAAMIDDVLGNASCSGDAWCKKSGYNFRLNAVCKVHLCKEYVVVATPIESNTGIRSFCSTSDGVVRFSTQAPLSTPVSATECRTWAPIR